MRNCVLLGIVCMLAAVRVGKETVADAPAPALPKSAKARQALRDYDRAVQDAEEALEKARSDADAQRRRALQAALDEALQSKDLDEANAIKASMGEPKSGAVNKGVSLVGSKWQRFAIDDRGGCSNASIVFQPNGRLEGTRTKLTSWKLDGDSLVLGFPGGTTTRFTARRDVTVFVTDGAPSAKGSQILVPASLQKGQRQR
jgi:hypothetical protein